MDLPLELLALYLGIIIPVIGAIIAAWIRLGSKLNRNSDNITDMKEVIKAHGLESKLSDAELENLKLKVAMIEKDIEFLKQKVFGQGSPI